MNIGELRSEAARLGNLLREVEVQWREEKAKLVAEVEKAMREKYNGLYVARLNDLHAANAKVKAAKIEAAKSDPMRGVKVRKKIYSMYGNKVVGYEYGIVEIYESDSQLPDGKLAYWMKGLNPGQKFVRLLKKDGSPSKRIVEYWAAAGDRGWASYEQEEGGAS